ncbi:MAG: hypothetical protein ACT4OO_16355 [Nitrospiraceae bacterium]
MNRGTGIFFVLLGLTLGGLWSTAAQAQEAASVRILIHMKTSLVEDDAQICAVPNVAWAAVKAGHKVTILVDASAVKSVTKGFGWFNHIFRPDSTALDRAALPERERQSLSEQMDVPLEQVPHNYGEYFEFLKKLGVEIYGNRTMMLLYQIDPARVAADVAPIPLDRMVSLFTEADKVVVY